jgi:hypothetical protein
MKLQTRPEVDVKEIMMTASHANIRCQGSTNTVFAGQPAGAPSAYPLRL